MRSNKNKKTVSYKKDVVYRQGRPNSVYAFVDSQNLNLGVQNDVYRNSIKVYSGWKLDFKKFRIYLLEKYKVDKAFLFIGYVSENQKLYKYLKSSGYTLIFKPSVLDSHGHTKGNVDSELVVWTMKSVYEDLCDKAIIVSGDGDFAVLANFLLSKNKLLKFIVPNRTTMSILIKRVFVRTGKFNLLGWLNDERVRLGR